MVRTTVLLALASVATSCADDGPQPVQFAEHCGAHEPVRLLALQPDQSWSSTTTLGDRLYHTLVRTHADGSLTEDYTGAQLWSTGLCGESPRHIADDLAPVRPQEHIPWPELLLGCLPGTGIFIIDPAGEAPPQLLFSGESCFGNFTPYGYLQLTSEGDSLAYLLYPYPDDPHSGPLVPIVLNDHLLGQQSIDIEVDDGVVHVIDDEYTLLRIDLADRSTTAVQTQVRDFRYSPDRRYLLWQDAAPTGGDPSHPTGALLLGDTTTGTSVGLGDTYSGLVFTTHWLADDLLGVTQSATDRLYRLPGLDFIDMAPGGRLLAHPGGRSLLLTNEYQGDWLSRLDPDDGTITPLFTRQAQFIRITEDAAIVLDVPVDTNDPITPEGKLWSVPFDGSPATVLADRATRRTAIDPEFALTTVDISVDPRHEGTWLRVDTDSHDERVIDEHVTGWQVLDFDDLALLTYAKYDGERTGIWQARLPPVQ